MYVSPPRNGASPTRGIQWLTGRSTVIFDTGSTDLILPKEGCTTCGSHPLFDPPKSTSFSDKPGTNVTIAFGTAGQAIPLDEPEPVSGNLVADVITINGASVPNQTFLLCDNYPDTLTIQPSDGVFGLGPPGVSLLARLSNTSFPTWFWSLVDAGSVPEPVFSFYLNSGSASPGGQLTLGGTDPSMYEGDIKKVPFNATITTGFGEWFINTPTFFVNSKSVSNSDSGAAFPAGISLLDTGTAFIQTPDFETARDIYAAISPEIKQIDKKGTWGAACDVMEKLSPDLTFTIGSGDDIINMTVPVTSFNLGTYPGKPGMCQGVILNAVQPTSDAASVWVLGSPLLKGYYTVWDGENLELGVAKLSHSAANNGNGGSSTSGASALLPSLVGYAIVALLML